MSLYRFVAKFNLRLRTQVTTTTHKVSKKSHKPHKIVISQSSIYFCIYFFQKQNSLAEEHCDRI